ncbi:hypothetical protein FH712_10015 [Marinobacter nauticus]|uniref:hypothetical protein n=1 Tax=Marinobacter nauticus TaxID=2743 RepID=UPI00112F8F8C|nr:hypothetical protein [Marinobacter nauticus]TPW23422.1 hypothetical protein FH712_10015 [Marinobacter nauticus]
MEIVAVIISTLTMIITAVALGFTVTSFKKQLQLNFFADYTKRYQEIILNFPESINEQDFDLEKLPEDQRDRTLRNMRAYFDLCSEEYFLWREGNIDDKTWAEWESGIKFAFSKPAFQQAWQRLRLDTIYYGEFTEFVNGAIYQEST